jgi:hypothetical protein
MSVARFLVVVSAVAACGALLQGRSAQAMPDCSTAGGEGSVTAPTTAGAWRAGIQARTPVFDRLPGTHSHASRWLAVGDAPSLLVLGGPRASGDHCWLRVRLPWRPNDAAGWVDADDVVLERVQWRIEISRARRTLTLFRAGTAVRTVQVVVGRPNTPTPEGLFAVTWAIRWHPREFLGSWVLELTAHSGVLQRYDGGDGTVAIHGRGGSSLHVPLGSARSHGCVRLANGAIDWLVRTVGASRLPGTPVHIG